MTRDELIEKIAVNIHESMWANVDFDRLHGQQKKHLRQEAEVAVNTILEALKEPTDEMVAASSGYIISYPENQYCIKDDAKDCWQAMLNASPLAKEG